MILILATVFLAASCAKEDSDYQKQVENIQKFVTSETEKDPDINVTEFGDIVRLTYPYAETCAIETSKAQAGSQALVKISYSAYVFKGSISTGNLFATNDLQMAESQNFDTSDPEAFEPIVISLADKSILEGLRTGLLGVRAGEECTILFPSRYGMGNRYIGTIPASSALAFEVSVIDIEN